MKIKLEIIVDSFNTEKILLMTKAINDIKSQLPLSEVEIKIVA